MAIGPECTDPSDYWSEEQRREEMGWVKEEELNDEGYFNRDDVQEWLDAMIESMYDTGNVQDLEHSFEELCHMFQVQLPIKQLLIDAKKCA